MLFAWRPLDHRTMASASDSSQRLQSNEEVIEELTRDLESSCVRADGDAKSKGDPWDVVDKEGGDESAQNTDVPTEDVDEELLKDRDLLLTESEQEVRLCDRILFRDLLFSVIF